MVNNFAPSRMGIRNSNFAYCARICARLFSASFSSFCARAAGPVPTSKVPVASASHNLCARLQNRIMFSPWRFQAQKTGGIHRLFVAKNAQGDLLEARDRAKAARGSLLL
jgi:hypothetical protein